jgi:thiol-disulfide isomerase/thioredoxin
VVAAALALVVALGAAACGGGDGERLPSLGLERLDAPGTLRTDELGDLPVVVNLWATWCVPCRAELPAFDEVAAEMAGSVRVVGVNVGEERATAEALVAELGLGFEQYLDPDADLSAGLGVTTMPTTVFVDAGGDIVDLHAGPLTADELRDRIDTAFTPS